MATDVLKDIQKVQDAAKAEYGGKMSNQFVAEMKGSTLFQFNWGELLAAAPTALSLMGGCWLAASDPKADKISLADSMPSKGFVYLTNMHSPTLRSYLVDGMRIWLVATNSIRLTNPLQCVTMEGERLSPLPVETWTHSRSAVNVSQLRE